MEELSKCVGLDVHKDTIAVAAPGRSKRKSPGIITNTTSPSDQKPR